MNLFQKLLEIKKRLPYFQKTAKGYGFNYVNGSNILSVINPIANDLGVFLQANVLTHAVEPVKYMSYSKDKDGNATSPVEKLEFLINGTIEYTWIDTDSGDKLSVTFPFMAMQSDPSQALGSALTYTERYFHLKFFNIETDKDDPDAYEKKIDRLTGADVHKGLKERVKKGIDACKKVGVDNDKIEHLTADYEKDADVDKLENMVTALTTWYKEANAKPAKAKAEPVQIITAEQASQLLADDDDLTPPKSPEEQAFIEECKDAIALAPLKNELRTKAQLVEWGCEEEKAVVLQKIEEIKSEKDYRVIKGQLESRPEKGTRRKKNDPIPTDVKEMQDKVKSGLTHLTMNCIDKFDNPTRKNNSIKSALGVNTVDECLDFNKLKEYREHLLDKYNDWKANKDKNEKSDSDTEE